MAFRPLEAASEDTVVEDAPRRGFKPLEGAVIDEPAPASSERSFIDTIRKTVSDFGSAIASGVRGEITPDAIATGRRLPGRSVIADERVPVVSTQMSTTPGGAVTAMIPRRSMAEPPAPASTTPPLEIWGPDSTTRPGVTLSPEALAAAQMIDRATRGAASAPSATATPGDVTFYQDTPVGRALRPFKVGGMQLAQGLRGASGMAAAILGDEDVAYQAIGKGEAIARKAQAIQGAPGSRNEMGAGAKLLAGSAPTLAAAALPLAVGLPALAGVSAGSRFAQPEADPMTPLSLDDRARLAAIYGGAEFVTERFALPAQLKAIVAAGSAMPRSVVVPLLARAIVIDGGGEMGTELAQNLAEKIVGERPEITGKEIVENMAEAGLQGVAQSLGMAGLGLGVGKVSDRMRFGSVGAGRVADLRARMAEQQATKDNRIAEIARQLLRDSEQFDPGPASAATPPVPQARPGTVPRPPYLPGAEGTPPVLPGDLLSPEERILGNVRQLLDSIQPSQEGAPLPTISPEFQDNGTPMIVQGRNRGKFAGERTESATPVGLLPAPSQVPSSPDQQIRPSETIQGRQDDTEAITAAVRRVIGQQDPARDVTPRPPAPQPEPRATEYTVRPTERAASAFVGDRAALGPAEDVARVLQAAQTPAFARTAEDISILRRYPDLAQAAMTPGFQRSAEQTALVKRAEQETKVESEDRVFDDQTPRAQTETPQFKRWFGESKVVDAQGKPLVVYHGTRHDFDSFRLEGRRGQDRMHYFATDPGVASEYGGQMQYGTPNVMPVHLSLKNPYVFDAGGAQWGSLPITLFPDEIRSRFDERNVLRGREGSIPQIGFTDVNRAAQSAGYDGVVARNILDGAGEYGDKTPTDVYVAFRPEQIKSAIGNRGNFDPNSDRIVDDATPPARSVTQPAASSIKTANGTELGFKSPKNRDAVRALNPQQRFDLEAALEELGPTVAPPDVIAGLTFASRSHPSNGSFWPDQNVVTLSPDRLDMLRSNDPLDRADAMHTLAHEIAHAVDFAANKGQRDAVSMESGRLASMWSGQPAGDLFVEAYDAWLGSQIRDDLHRVLSYPLDALFNGMSDKTMRLELFAQVSALYNTNLELVRDKLPTWATTLEQIYGNPETGEGAPQSADEVSQRLREALSNEGAGARAEERVPESQTDRSANAVGPGPARGPPRPGVGTPPRAGAQPAGQRAVGGGPRGPGAAAGATAGPTWGLNEPSLRDRLLREWQDKFIDVKRVREEMQRAAGLLNEGNNAYLAEELYHGRVSARVNKATRQHIEPLLEAMKATKITADELGRYLWARHAPERNKQMAKVNPGGPGNLSGLYDDAAAAARDGNAGAPNAADIIAGFRGRLGDLNRLAAMVDGITAATRQILVSEGLESQATINAWGGAYKNYVPLFRDTEEASAGQGFKVAGAESKRAMGSQKEAIAILAAVISQHERAIIRAERAKVGRTLVQMAEDNPNPDFWKIDTPPMKRTINPSTGLVQVSTDPLYRQRDDVFIVKDKGPNGTVIERVITFNPSNERAMAIAQAMNNLGVVQLGAVTKIVGRVSRLLANLATSWNPQFWVTNAARDVQTAAVNLQDTELRGRAPQVIANIPKAMAGIISAEKGQGTSQWAQTFRAFQDAGGQTGWMQMWDDLRDRHQAIAKQLDRANRSKLDPREIGHKALEYIELANTAIENAIRVAAFAEARKIGLTDKRAASIAKNMTVNFNRKGNRSVAANAWYMFFNASVQGTARLVQAIATSRRARLYSGMMVAFSAALEIMNRMLWDDDRDPEGNVRYELIPEYVRQKNMIFMLPDGKHVAIPLPYGFNVFHSAGRLMAEAILTASGSSTVQERRKPSELAWAFTQTVMDSFVPLGSAGSPLQYAAPTIADPFVQYLENKTFFGSPMRPEPLPMSGPMPDYKQYFRSTSDTAKDLARWLSTTTGGDERQGGAIDISPTTIEHIVKTATGGTGQFGLVMLDFSRHVIDRALGEAEPEDYPARRIPFVGKFYGEVDDRDMAGKYYRLREDATKSLKLLKAYQQDGDLEAAAKVEDEKGPLIAMAREISSQQYRRSMSEIRKQFQALDGLPADERAKERRMLQRDEATLMARALRAYNEAQESAR